MSDLADVFEDDVETAQEEVTDEPQGEPEVTDTESEGEQEPPTEELDEEAGPPPAESEAGTVPVAALADERRKRQEAEEKLRQYEANKQQPDENTETTIEDLVMQRSIAMSAEIMREARDDYDEMEAVFLQLAEQDKTLWPKMYAQPHPAKFAYETAKDHIEVQTLKKLKDSGELAEFEKWKAEKAAAENTPQPAEPTEAEKRKESALATPSLTQATQAERLEAKEPPATLDDVFGDSPF